MKNVEKNVEKNKDDNDKDIRESSLGFQVEKELKELFESKQLNLTIDELKSKAPKSYNVIFENYNDKEDNGVQTSHYRAIETTKNNYRIDKLW